MMEVEVENFQSIERASFKIEGFTALVGRSNIGKSAIIRALKCALTGALGTDFVRHGPQCERRLKNNKKCRCQTTVRLKTPDMTMVWEKGDAVNRYTVTFPDRKAEVFDKPGGGTPDFLKPGFEPVKVGDSAELIQVSDQFSPIFLLNQSGPTVADVLSDVARLDDINTAMRLVAKDRKTAVSTRNVREADITNLRGELAGYDGLEKAAERVEGVEQKHKAVEVKQVQLRQAESFIETISDLAVTMRGLKAAVAPELPESDSMQAGAERVVLAERLLGEVLKRAPVVRGLAGVDKVALPQVEPVEQTWDSVVRLEGWLTRLDRFKGLASAKALEGVVIPAPESLATGLVRLERAGQLLGRWEASRKAQSALEANLKEATEEEAQALQEFEELGVCPTCSQQIGPEHSIHREAS